MEFVKIGKRVLNLSQIAHLEIIEGTPARVLVQFVGVSETLSLYDEEAEVLLDYLEAKDPAEELHKVRGSLNDLIKELPDMGDNTITRSSK